jgi:5-methylcytosine-specific restriction protein A
MTGIAGRNGFGTPGRIERNAHIDVESGHLHTQVGEDPNSNRISVCCEVMRKMMRIGDSIVNEPPSGEGATLMIRYIV